MSPEKKRMRDNFYLLRSNSELYRGHMLACQQTPKSRVHDENIRARKQRSNLKTLTLYLEEHIYKCIEEGVAKIITNTNTNIEEAKKAILKELGNSLPSPHHPS